MTTSRAELQDAAREAAVHAYAPYSQFEVGAALAFEDGAVITGANVENASYGLSLCAEALALSKAMNEGRRGGLLAVAVTGPGKKPTMPCGRCRQMLHEMAVLGETDPLVWSGMGDEAVEMRLSALLPMVFGPEDLA